MSLYLDFTLRVLAAQIAVSRWFGFEPPLTPSPDEAETLCQELQRRKEKTITRILSWRFAPQGFSHDTPVPTEPFIAVPLSKSALLAGYSIRVDPP